jgi:hypothetical protein
MARRNSQLKYYFLKQLPNGLFGKRISEELPTGILNFKKMLKQYSTFGMSFERIIIKSEERTLGEKKTKNQNSPKPVHLT